MQTSFQDYAGSPDLSVASPGGSTPELILAVEGFIALAEELKKENGPAYDAAKHAFEELTQWEWLNVLKTCDKWVCKAADDEAASDNGDVLAMKDSTKLMWALIRDMCLTIAFPDELPSKMFRVPITHDTPFKLAVLGKWREAVAAGKFDKHDELLYKFAGFRELLVRALYGLVTYADNTRNVLKHLARGMEKMSAGEDATPAIPKSAWMSMDKFCETSESSDKCPFTNLMTEWRASVTRLEKAYEKIAANNAPPPPGFQPYHFGSDFKWMVGPEAMEAIDHIKGMGSVKRQLEDIVTARFEGMKINTPNNGFGHLVFVGNPGSGKSEIAASVVKIINGACAKLAFTGDAKTRALEDWAKHKRLSMVLNKLGMHTLSDQPKIGAKPGDLQYLKNLQQGASDEAMALAKLREQTILSFGMKPANEAIKMMKLTLEVGMTVDIVAPDANQAIIATVQNVDWQQGGLSKGFLCDHSSQYYKFDQATPMPFSDEPGIDRVGTIVEFNRHTDNGGKCYKVKAIILEPAAPRADITPGCGHTCTAQHNSDGQCLVCGRTWQQHESRHMCPGAQFRGSYIHQGVQASSQALEDAKKKGKQEVDAKKKKTTAVKSAVGCPPDCKEQHPDGAACLRCKEEFICHDGDDHHTCWADGQRASYPINWMQTGSGGQGGKQQKPQKSNEICVAHIMGRCSGGTTCPNGQKHVGDSQLPNLKCPSCSSSPMNKKNGGVYAACIKCNFRIADIAWQCSSCQSVLCPSCVAGHPPQRAIKVYTLPYGGSGVRKMETVAESEILQIFPDGPDNAKEIVPGRQVKVAHSPQGKKIESFQGAIVVDVNHDNNTVSLLRTDKKKHATNPIVEAVPFDIVNPPKTPGASTDNLTPDNQGCLLQCEADCTDDFAQEAYGGKEGFDFRGGSLAVVVDPKSYTGDPQKIFGKLRVFVQDPADGTFQSTYVSDVAKSNWKPIKFNEFDKAARELRWSGGKDKKDGPASMPPPIYHKFTGSQLLMVNPADFGQELKKMAMHPSGGILFIDEAYQLNPQNSPAGAQLLMLIMEAMEADRKKITVIFAGYEDQLDKVMNYNEGLRSRFNSWIKFRDYTEGELHELYDMFVKKNANGRLAVAKGHEQAQQIVVRRISRGRGMPGFGNARTVRSEVDCALNRAHVRLHGEDEVQDEADPDNVQRRVHESVEKLHDLTWSDILGQAPVSELKGEYEPIQKLQAMIGFRSMKETVMKVFHTIINQQVCELQGTPTDPVVLHQRFYGNQGTGKTTVARIYGQVLADLGVVKKQDVYETTPGKLKGVSEAETNKNVVGCLEAAKEKILFIDEAYGLSGQAALTDALVQYIQPTAEFRPIIILAGYRRQMEEMLSGEGVNPGLKRRVSGNGGRALEFEGDMCDKDMALLIPRLAEKYSRRKRKDVITLDVIYHAVKLLQNQAQGANFGNGGAVDNLVRDAVAAAQSRTANTGSNYKTLTRNDFGMLPSTGTPVQLPKSSPLSKWYETTKKIVERHRENGITKKVESCWMIVGGNGVGKRMHAKALAQYLVNLNSISTNKVNEIAPESVIGQYVGQSVPMLTKAVRDSLGGMLFIPHVDRWLSCPPYGFELISALAEVLNRDDFKGKLAICVSVGNPNAVQSIMEHAKGTKWCKRIDLQSPVDVPDLLDASYQHIATNALTASCPAGDEKLRTALFKAWEDIIDSYSFNGALRNFSNFREVSGLVDAIEEKSEGEIWTPEIIAEAACECMYAPISSAGQNGFYTYGGPPGRTEMYKQTKLDDPPPPLSQYEPEDPGFNTSGLPPEIEHMVTRKLDILGKLGEKPNMKTVGQEKQRLKTVALELTAAKNDAKKLSSILQREQRLAKVQRMLGALCPAGFPYVPLPSGDWVCTGPKPCMLAKSDVERRMRESNQ